MTAFVDSKADRLIRDGQIGEVAGARVFAVSGDHGVYRVVTYVSGVAECTCPAEGSCSHARAARRLLERESEQVAA
jgi:hypothetical protein